MRRNVENNVQNIVSGIVADFVSRNVPGFHDKALVRAIETEVGNNFAEVEDKFVSEFDVSFTADFDVRFVTGNATICATDRRPPAEPANGCSPRLDCGPVTTILRIDGCRIDPDLDGDGKYGKCPSFPARDKPRSDK